VSTGAHEAITEPAPGPFGDDSPAISPDGRAVAFRDLGCPPRRVESAAVDEDGILQVRAAMVA
jgi:hypothetical protein